MQKSTKIVIADDMEPILLYLEKVINEVSEFEVVAKAKDGKELIDCVLEFKPDLVITDIEMPNCTGIEAVEKLNKKQVKTKYICITGSSNELITTKAKEIGILKVIKKPIMDNKKFISQIQSVLQMEDISENEQLEIDISFKEIKKENIIIKTFKKIFKSK